MSVTSTPLRTQTMKAIKVGGGVIRWVPDNRQQRTSAVQPVQAAPTSLMRNEMGATLREIRQASRRTLRDVATNARVSLGYLSEVERGKKEISSEILSSVCNAMNISLAKVLQAAAARIELAEGLDIPDTVPESFTQVPELV